MPTRTTRHTARYPKFAARSKIRSIAFRAKQRIRFVARSQRILEGKGSAENGGATSPSPCAAKRPPSMPATSLVILSSPAPQCDETQRPSPHDLLLPELRSRLQPRLLEPRNVGLG